MMTQTLIRRSLSLLTIIAASASLFTAVPQRRPSGGAVAKASGGPAAKCSGAWTGTITYTRTQSVTDNKTTPRVSGRGEDTRNWEMKYDYKAQVTVVEAPDRNSSSIGKGTVTHSFSSSETTKSVERNSCDRGKTWQEMSGTFTTESKTAGTDRVEASVHVGVNSDGTYSVSVGLPPIKGETTGKQTSAFSGQCVAKEGKNLTLPPTQTTVEGNSLSTDGSHRLDPSDPNRISGTYTNTNLGVTETITWNLQKCGAPLRLNDLKFDHMKFPNWDNWIEIAEQTGTVDGNWVKVRAKVLNASGETKYADVSFKETYKGDKWDGARPDRPIKDHIVSVRLDPGEERDVEVLWDTSGYAWFDDGRPRLVQRIKAEIWENNKKVDEMTRNIKIAPKPLVLVHGLWSNWKAWEAWQNILTTAHSYDWKAFPVGEKSEKGVMNTGGEFLSSSPTNSIVQNARELEKYIRYAQEDRNAWHVDIVAHSMGGLISRSYISNLMPGNLPDGRPPVSHLVMLGTPNMGSPCADVMGMAFELTGKKVEAIRELRPAVVKQFNQVTTNRKGVKFSVLAGDPLPTMCKTIVWNDGVVPVPSAIWEIGDNARSSSIHTELTGTSDFSKFVKPRLAVGPGGDHAPAAPQLPKSSGLFRQERDDSIAVGNVPHGPMAELFTGGHGGAGVRDLSPSVSAQTTPDEQPFARAVTVPAKQSIDVELVVGTVRNFGVTFMAQSGISATLLNDKGAVLAKNVADSREARSWFRSLFVDGGFVAGTWKLRLENTGSLDADVILTTWTNAGQ